jgi:glutamate racemase
MNKNSAIGIFDSGIGGLTVGHQIARLMPQERIVYFGDTKHLPYGDKSPEAIIRFSKRITQFLLEQNCKMIVIACNTASALAFEHVKTLCKDKAIAINVIDPVVKFTAYSKAKSVGIIGTKNTILSDVYAKKIQSLSTAITTNSLATPLLVPMIEEGFYQHKISQTILSNYLEREELRAIDHLILGCTHYPLIEEEIKQYYKGTVEVINSARIVSKHVKNALMNDNLLNNESHTITKHQFYLSDYTSSFEQSAQHFFGEKISLVETNID